VGAIVLRVDSPGGDPLASEYIAKIIRENIDKKPIIVSQGMLAASGGYWLSMDADEIYTTPMTITGSIGVISGWVYDKGLQDTLGIDYDYIKRGEFSDLGLAWNDPLIGLGLPVRDMTEREEELRKDQIMELYDDFTEKVAKGRDMDQEDVKEVAQGRVWTGRRAVGINLADKIGGLSQAIDRAIDLMDVEDEDDVIIEEYPPQGDFDFRRLMPSFLVSAPQIEKSLERLHFLVDLNGKPVPMLPLDYSGGVLFCSD
jgi:protease-4